MVVLIIIVYRRHPVLAIQNLDAFRFTRSFLAHVVYTSLRSSSMGLLGARHGGVQDRL